MMVSLLMMILHSLTLAVTPSYLLFFSPGTVSHAGLAGIFDYSQKVAVSLSLLHTHSYLVTATQLFGL